MYRSKYMKQRRDYIISELVQIIGCVIFMIILLISCSANEKDNETIEAEVIDDKKDEL